MPNTVQINLSSLPQPAGPPKWRLCRVQGQQAQCGDDAATYPVLEFLEGTGPRLIVFKLEPGPYRFHEDDPIWVSETAKPELSSHHDEIIDATVFDNGKTLVVVNKNSDDVDLFYNLNMRDTGNAQHNVDPEIKNGGHGFFGSDAAMLLIGGAVLAALVAALVSYFVARATVHSLVPTPPKPRASSTGSGS